MKMLVEVLGPAEEMPRGGLFQPIAIHYPGRRYPVEEKLFLKDGIVRGRRVGDPEDALPVGRYEIDTDTLIFPDVKNYNRMSIQRLATKHLTPLKAKAAA